jgi:F0F1-type ATP synthase delta subunit
MERSAALKTYTFYSGTDIVEYVFNRDGKSTSDLSFYTNLYLFYKTNIEKFVAKNKKKFYNEFKKEFLNYVCENVYNKIKSNIINYYVEKPCLDIFEIAFNRYLNAKSGFTKHFEKINSKLIQKECQEKISFQFVEENGELDSAYISIKNFKNILEKLDRTSDGNEISLLTDNGLDIIIKLFSNTDKKYFSNIIKMMIVKNIRDLFLSKYIDEILCESNEMLNRVVIDIAAFNVRNALSLNELANDVTKRVNDVLSKIKDTSEALVYNDITETVDSENQKCYKYSYEYTISDIILPLYSLIGKVDGMIRTTETTISDTFIDTEPIHAMFEEHARALKTIVENIKTNIYDKYLNSGLKDPNLCKMVSKAIEMYVSEKLAPLSKQVYVQSMKGLDATFLKDINYKLDEDKTTFMDLLRTCYFFNAETEEKLKKDYDKMYDFLINDLETNFIVIKDQLSIYLKNLISIITDICYWLNDKLLHRIQYMGNYNVDKIVVYELQNAGETSPSSDHFLNCENSIFYEFLNKIV